MPSSQCRAKDPSSCRHHGQYKSQLNTAVTTRNLDNYLRVRGEMERAVANPEESPQFKALVESALPYVNSEFSPLYDQLDDEGKEKTRQLAVKYINVARNMMLPDGRPRGLAVEAIAEEMYYSRGMAESGYRYEYCTKKEQTQLRREATFFMESISSKLKDIPKSRASFNLD